MSLMGKPANGAIACETGIAALAMKGLGTRVLMPDDWHSDGLTVWMHDSSKMAMGMGTYVGCRTRAHSPFE